MTMTLPRRYSGFSAIELMVALCLVGLLLLAAFPNYREVLLKARRAEARAALYTVMLQQERYFTEHNRYVAFMPSTSNTPNLPFKWWSGASVDHSYYRINAQPCLNKALNQCVVLTATSDPESLFYIDDPICGDLMLDSAHNKTYSKGEKPNPVCW
jgi:type IV pilus assembly protein PilE